MARQTYSDCITCPTFNICDAHNADGTWKHDEGANPCDLGLMSETNDFQMLKKS